MKKFLVILSFCISSLIIAQAPPPPSVPTEDNKVLIDELIRVTEFENYFNNYCKTKVEQAAKENNWDEKKKHEISNSINFRYFKGSIYNSFSSDSKETLHNAVILFKNMNSTRKESVLKIVPINEMLQINLEGYVKSMLKGNYLISN